MLIIFVNVIYVLVAVAMIVLILLQRGAGASAGAGFGGGASATVFGARGSANFLSKATKWLALVFFTICLGMAVYASKSHNGGTASATDLGVMGGVQTESAAPAQPANTTPGQASGVPAPVSLQPAQSVPVNGAPAVPAPQPVAPASNTDNGTKPGNKGG